MMSDAPSLLATFVLDGSKIFEELGKAIEENLSYRVNTLVSHECTSFVSGTGFSDILSQQVALKGGLGSENYKTFGKMERKIDPDGSLGDRINTIGD